MNESRTRRPRLVSEGAGEGDRLLAKRLAAGEEAALAEAYDLHAPLVYGLAQRVTDSRSAAEDITQDVFVYLWSHPERFDPDRGSLRAYLGVIAHRRSIDVLRSEGRRSRREVADAAAGARLEPSRQRPEAAVEDDIAARVRRAVGKLPDQQRQAVSLAYFGGHTYRSVATELGIPEGTAKSRLRLALTRLSDLLAAEGVLEWN
jgi:RNA polymerase sigma-70 factor (ECF subfamily)